MRKANSSPSKKFSDKNKANDLRRNLQTGRLKATPLNDKLLRVEVYIDGHSKSGVLVIPRAYWDDNEILMGAIQRLIELRTSETNTAAVYQVNRSPNG